MKRYYPRVSQNKTALITGGASGIGLATAERFLEAGARVVIGDFNKEKARQAVQSIRDKGMELGSLELDVSEEDSIINFFNIVRKTHGSIDVLVNSAGTGARMDAIELPLKLWQKVMDVNLTGSFLCAREAAGSMIEKERGSIVNVASIMGLVGGGIYPNPAYQTSKGGVVNLTRTLALDWAKLGIRVNAVAPAFLKTPLTQSLLEEPGMEQKLIDRTPMGRLVEASEVADAILFLASEASSMITGHTLPVDGGWVAQ